MSFLSISIAANVALGFYVLLLRSRLFSTINFIYCLGQPPHKHKCANEECGFVWQHTTAEGLADDGHNCPKCHAPQYERYFGDEEAGALSA